MAKKRYYADRDARMKKASKGSSGDMMPMYSNALAGMPQEVMMKSYKNESSYNCPEYPDTYSEKNKQYDAIIAKMNKHSFHGV